MKKKLFLGKIFILQSQKEDRAKRSIASASREGEKAAPMLRD